MKLHRRPAWAPCFSGLAAVVAAAGCTTPTHGGSFEPIGHSAEAVTVCGNPNPPTVNGVDVSVFQGTVDWSEVKTAGNSFAIARISDGTFLDTQFATNWTGMKAAGLVRGAYQYFEPGEDPAMQAMIVVSAVGMLGSGDLPVTADMETTGNQSPSTIAANLQTWADAVEAGTGKAPMIYTAEGYWDSDVASSAFSSNPLWVANWQVSCPDLPTGWTNWVFWQWNDMGTVSGISGAVDTDYFNGTAAQLTAFAGGGATASDGGSPSLTYGAEYVSQSWPLATTTMMMTTCQTMPANIVLKNIGTATWDSRTRFATTQPRNRVSDFADSTWVATDRPAEVTGTVAPGATYEFKFDFHAPPTPGMYDEYFGMVEDGVAWFSDPGQGGPPDDDIQAKIEVTDGGATCVVDPGVPDAAPGQGDAEAADAAPPQGDGGPGPDAAPADAGSPVVLEGGVGGDTGTGATRPPPREPSSGSGGCSCRVVAGEGGSSGGVVAGLSLAAIAVTRRRRRR
jgi:lysozyme